MRAWKAYAKLFRFERNRARDAARVWRGVSEKFLGQLERWPREQTSAFAAKDARIRALEVDLAFAKSQRDDNENAWQCERTRVEELKHELRKYEPSDAVMIQLLALNECIRAAAELLDNSGSVLRDMPEFINAVDAWLKLPAVAAARKSVRRENGE